MVQPLVMDADIARFAHTPGRGRRLEAVVGRHRARLAWHDAIVAEGKVGGKAEYGSEWGCGKAGEGLAQMGSSGRKGLTMRGERGIVGAVTKFAGSLIAMDMFALKATKEKKPGPGSGSWWLGAD
jgi:hypothetical protein